MKGDTNKNRQEARSFGHLFVYKPIQRQYFLWMAIIVIISAFAISFVVHQTIHTALANEMARTSKVSLVEILGNIESNLLIGIFIIFFIAVVVAAIISVFFLHRVVGPIYRIQEALKKVAEGQVPPKDIKLRTGDFFSEVAQELNKVLARLRSKNY